MSLTDEVKTTYSGKRSPKTRLATAALIREALMKARNYHTSWKLAETDPSKKPPKFDMKLHSLMRVFDGMPVKITAKRSYDMATAIRIAEEFGLHYTLEDCTESWLIPDLLKKHNVSCVVGPSYGSKSNENRNRDPIVGSVLEEHGIPFAASTAHPKMNIELAAIHLTLMYKKRTHCLNCPGISHHQRCPCLRTRSKGRKSGAGKGCRHCDLGRLSVRLLFFRFHRSDRRKSCISKIIHSL